MREVREVHHTDGGGTAMGMMLGIILIVAVLAVGAFFMFSGRMGSGATQPNNSPTNIQVNPPSAPAPPGKVDVNVNPPAAPSKP